MERVQAVKDAVSRWINSIEETLYKYGIYIPSWIHLLIWVIAIVVLVGLTLNDIIPLVSDYHNDTTNVAIKTRLITNGTFAPPTLILAIPQFKIINPEANAVHRISMHLSNGTVDECVECQQLADEKWDVWRDMDISMKSNNIKVFEELVLALMHKVIKSMESGVDVLDVRYSPWNLPLIDACLIFLAYQWNTDASFGGNILSTLNVYESNRRWNGTRMLDFLDNRCMKALCYETRLSLTTSGGVEYSCPQLIPQDSMPIIMTLDYIWIPIPCSSIEECDATLHFVYAKDDPSDMWAPPTNYPGGNKIMLFTDPSAQYRSQLDPPLQLSSNLYRESAGLAYPQVTVIYSMTMVTVEKRDHIKEKCYKDSNLNLCLNKCSKLWIMQHCGCIPFTYRKGINWPDPSLSYCTYKHYTDCDPMAHRNVKDEYCAKQCVYPCHYNSYNWHVYRDELSIEPYQRTPTATFTFTFIPLISPFLEFAWTTKDTPQTFASQIGGILSLYLGLSGLSAFIFIITCLEFGQRLSRRKRHQERSDKTIVISLWQMLLMSKSTNHPQAQNSGQSTPSSCLQSDTDNDSCHKAELTKISDIIREEREENARKFEKMQSNLEEMGKETDDKFQKILNTKLSELEAKIRDDINLAISSRKLYHDTRL